MSVVPVYTPEFPPPAHLGNAEAAVFRDIVGTCDRNHFRQEDRELIALYATHVVVARKLMARKRRTPEQERDLRGTTSIVMSLSTKLRLGPKSRAPDNRRAQSAGLRGGFRPPWEVVSAPSEQAEATEEPLEARWTDRGPAERDVAENAPKNDAHRATKAERRAEREADLATTRGVAREEAGTSSGRS
jgi:hypothetical protein